MMRTKVPLVIAAGLSMAVVVLPIPAAATTKSQLHAKALSVSNFPAGWSVDNSPVNSSPSSCLSKLGAPSKHITRVQVAYVNGNVPALQETLETGSGAAVRFGSLKRLLSRCKSLSLTASDGTVIKGTIGAMSFPVVGSSSSAYSASLSAKGFNFGVDIVLFQVGQVVGDIVYEDLGTVDITSVEGYVTEAVNKIEGKATVTPTTF